MEKKEKRLNKNLIKGNIPNKSLVEFMYYAPHVEDVYLAGEFNNWDIHSIPMGKKLRIYTISGGDFYLSILEDVHPSYILHILNYFFINYHAHSHFKINNRWKQQWL